MPKPATKSKSKARKKGAQKAGNRGVLVVMMLAAFGVGGFAAYVKLDPAARHVPADLKRSSRTVTEDSGGDDSGSERINRFSVPRQGEEGGGASGVKSPATVADDGTLRIPKINGLQVTLGDPAPPVPDDQDPKVFLATQTLAAMNIEKAKSLGVTVKGRNATLDFNPEFRDHGYGTQEEGTLVKALQTALGQFKDIDTFQMSVDGELLTDLGALDLSEPIPVIRDGKEVTPSKTGISDNP